MQKLENLGIIGLLRRSVGNLRRSVDLRQGVEYLAAARPRCQNDTPRVRHGIALLRCGIAIVHNDKFLDCCSESLVFVRR